MRIVTNRELCGTKTRGHCLSGKRQDESLRLDGSEVEENADCRLIQTRSRPMQLAVVKRAQVWQPRCPRLRTRRPVALRPHLSMSMPV